MKTSLPSPKLLPPALLWGHAAVEQTIRQARHDVLAFIRWGFRDTQGQQLELAPVHGELQTFLTRNPYALVELPRDHGKSTQVCARVVWELGRQPGLRVKVVCATEALAVERVRFIRDAIDSNPWVRAVFPHLVKRVPWQAAAFTVRRPATVIGPTVSGVGVSSGSTGSRADLLICDDIVDVGSLASKTERQHVTSLFHENLLNLLEPQGRCWCLFTTWHKDDLNSRLKTNPAFPLFRRAVGPKLEPVWPGKWPTERLEERLKQIGPTSFARGYRLLASDEADLLIAPEWVQWWQPPSPIYDSIVLAVDPAVSTHDRADHSALVVLGRRGNQVHCLAALAKRWPLPELIHMMDQLNKIWNPMAILWETNGAFAGVKDLLTRQVRFGPKVVGINNTGSKASRIAALGVLVNSGTVRLQSGPGGPAPGQRELYEEMIGFPHADHDDLVDALAMGAAYLLDKPELRLWVVG